MLADGRVTNANAEANSDLFWALKGGGPNFGIVTRFDLFTVPVGQIWYQVSVYSVDQADEVLDAFVEWQENGASDVKSTVVLDIGLQSITVGLIYSAPMEQPTAFAPFYCLTPLGVAVPGTIGTTGSLTAIVGQTVSSTVARQVWSSSKHSSMSANKLADMTTEQRAPALTHSCTRMSIPSGKREHLRYSRLREPIKPLPFNPFHETLRSRGLPKVGTPWESH